MREHGSPSGRRSAATSPARAADPLAERVSDIWRQRVANLRSLPQADQALADAEAALQKAEDALKALSDERLQIEDELNVLASSSPHVAAARLLIEGLWQTGGEEIVGTAPTLIAPRMGLSALRPLLGGPLRSDVDEVLDCPDRRIADLSATFGLFACRHKAPGDE